MRLFLLLLLSMATASAAETATANLLEPKEVAPAAVTKLAEAYVKSLGKSENTVDRDAEAKRDFVRTFLTGFTSPKTSIGNPNDASAKGLEAGHVYRQEHPEKLKEILEGYGYVATEADGVWKFGFEVSDFRSNKTPKESWWVTVIGNEGEARAGAERVHVERSDDGVQVHVSGFLSPAGHYGHFGVGAREFFATSITPMKAK